MNTNHEEIVKQSIQEEKSSLENDLKQYHLNKMCLSIT